MTARSPLRRGPLVAALVIGLGLAAAPAAFQMFSRAPKGGDMIDEFRPFMDAATVSSFQGYLAQIGRAEDEARERLGTADGDAAARFPAVAELHRQWPVIDDDMGEMLTIMEADLDNFAAVDALPPFPLFPWFFVLPGVMVAGFAVWGLRTRGLGRGPRIALVAMGLGLVAAPAVFQMFTRAPKGGEMIDDFRPLMTERKVTSVQGYFLTLGAAEGALRTQVVPSSGIPPDDLPALASWSRDWPRISNEMAPMIGAMSDNVDNFAAVDAMPPFPLFPWFFVVPGLLVAGLAVAAGRPRPPA